MVSMIRLRWVLSVTSMSSLARLRRVVKVSCMPFMLGSGGLFRVGHMLDGNVGRLMFLGPPGVPGVLQRRRIFGALKIIARAGLVSVIVVGAMGVASMVVHVVAHTGR